MKVEDLQPNAVVRGGLPESTGSRTSVQWFKSGIVEFDSATVPPATSRSAIGSGSSQEVLP